MLLRATCARTVALRPLRAIFSTTARAMSDGDTGAPPKTGGQGDAFQRRERASEDYAIKQREREKLLELKKRVTEQQQHLSRLAKHIDEVTKDRAASRTNEAA